jgi:hypothetical protein
VKIGIKKVIIPTASSRACIILGSIKRGVIEKYKNTPKKGISNG